MKIKLSDRTLKLMLCISFISITFVLIGLKNSVISGYEPSIYISHSLESFVLIALLSYSLFVIGYFALFKVENNKLLGHHFLLLLLTYWILLTLPQLVEYAFYGKGIFQRTWDILLTFLNMAMPQQFIQL